MGGNPYCSAFFFGRVALSGNGTVPQADDASFLSPGELQTGLMVTVDPIVATSSDDISHLFFYPTNYTLDAMIDVTYDYTPAPEPKSTAFLACILGFPIAFALVRHRRLAVNKVAP
jgi:hypothetical protein